MYQFARLLAVGGFVATLLTGLALDSRGRSADLRQASGSPSSAPIGDDTMPRYEPGGDVIHARAGNDRVRGRGGNDMVCGGHGSDAALRAATATIVCTAGCDRLSSTTDGRDRHVGKMGDVLRGR